MEPITLTGLAIAFCSGMFTKASENSFDALQNYFLKKFQGTKTGRALEAGETVDPKQVTIDVKAIAPDSELEGLMAKVNELLAQNQDLRRQMEAAIAQAKNDTTINMTGESHDQSTFKQIGEVKGKNISF